MNSQLIKDFWENNPCGQTFITGDSHQINDYKDFFQKYDTFRYASESHILSNLDMIDFKEKKVLEIGIGQAADSQQIIEREGIYCGIDVTKEACSRAMLRFKIFNKPYEKVSCADASKIPFPDNYFDIIYSHGVLHHIPHIKNVVPELSRVLKKDGKLVIMVYARNSLNYYISILFLRRVLFLILYGLDILTLGRIIKNKLFRQHIDNAKAVGVMRYLKKDNFLSKNTDGPANPYSRVYSAKEVRNVFNLFSFYSFQQHFINERQLPFLKILPSRCKDFLANKVGWHLWCYGVKK